MEDLSSSPVSLKVHHINRKQRKDHWHSLLVIFIATIVTPAYSFSTNVQVKTIPTTIPRKSDIIQKAHTNFSGSGLYNRHSQRHVRRIHTYLASDTALDYYDPYITANKIDPKTQTISQSLIFYARFLVDHFRTKNVEGNKKRNFLQRFFPQKTKSNDNKSSMWSKMNEQRKNVMTLAGYTTSFVVPSFGFLLLGALMTSIVPSYWGKCIQCVATLTATKAQLIEALVGLGVSSFLAALFTGMRGSLFWIGGMLA